MKTRGWVYIIVNKAMKGLIKIGYSERDPLLRAIELESTGTPYKFTVIYDALVREPNKVEQTVHSQLKEFNADKEWFNCSIRVAIESIRQNSPKIYLEALDKELLSEIELKNRSNGFENLKIQKNDKGIKKWGMLNKLEQSRIIVYMMKLIIPSALDDKEKLKPAWNMIEKNLSNGLYLELWDGKTDLSTKLNNTSFQLIYTKYLKLAKDNKEFKKDSSVNELKRKEEARKAWAMIERKYHNSLILEVMREIYPEAWNDRTNEKGAEAFGKIKSGLEKGEYKYSEALKKIQDQNYKNSLEMWEKIKNFKEK